MTSVFAPATGAAGVLVLGGAAALVIAGGRSGRPAGPRILTALAAGLWGGEQLEIALRGGASGLPDPWWAVAVAALAVAGFALPSGAAREPLDRSRRVAEILLVGVALTMLIFNVWRPPAGTAPADVIGILTLVVLGSTLAALLIVAAVRDLDPKALAGAVAATLYVTVEVHGAVERLAGPGGGWPQPVLGGAAWLLLCATFLTAPHTPQPPQPWQPWQRDAEIRRLAVSTVLPLVLAVVSAVLFVSKGTAAGPTDLTLFGVFLAAFVGREAVRGTQQRRLLRRLAEQAATDPLTGVGNRRALEEALERLHASPSRPSSVLTIDLDGFKHINTLLGHQNGDALLVAVAAELTSQCGRAAVPAEAFRLGGDEFGVLVDGSPEDAEELAGRLLAAIPLAVATVPGAGHLDVSASIGLAHRDAADARRDGAPDDLLADLTHSGHAMRAAKAAGRARALTYGTPMALRQSRSAAIERRLRERLEDGRGLEPWFQPIISLAEMRMTGAEALARWGEDPELGVVTPAEFIPVAEDSGLIVELGRQVMRRTMEATIATGARAAELVTGVNASPLELRSPGLVDRVARLLDELAIPPAQFVLEITESVLIEHDDPAVPVIHGLADLGLSLALDDFGAGYSALSYVTELPVRILKLDKSITQRLGDPRGLAVARCVSDMARELGIDVVAEGVETREHLAAIQNLSVEFGQGWLFSAAVSPDRFAEYVRNPDLAMSAGSGLPVKMP